MAPDTRLPANMLALELPKDRRLIDVQAGSLSVRTLRTRDELAHQRESFFAGMNYHVELGVANDLQ